VEVSQRRDEPLEPVGTQRVPERLERQLDPLPPPGPPDIEKLDQVGPRYGAEIVGRRSSRPERPVKASRALVRLPEACTLDADGT
jgi:hypothetical protein